MSLFNRQRRSTKTRDVPADKTVAWLCSPEAYDTLCVSGYTNLAHNPEIQTGVNRIAEMVASMTIHLMANTDNGDVRLKNELSRKVDINPNRYMTRQTYLQAVMRTLLLEGQGNAVVYPKTSNGFLEDLIPIAPTRVSFVPDGYGYKIVIDGEPHNPDDLLHFVINPDPNQPWRGQGYQVILRDVANNLKQAAATKKGFLESKWKPSVIIKVDALADEFASPSGRRKLLSEYIETDTAGQPWLIPADQFAVEQVKPLSLNDLAINEAVELDKKTVAAILGVPPFVVGAGDFDKAAWNHFINTKIMLYALIVQQEKTRKLLLSPDWYFKFNPRSLYAYDMSELAKVGDDQFVRGIMTGNEVRDWIGLSPKEGLDELVILENYIPRGMIGEQSKLSGGEDIG